MFMKKLLTSKLVMMLFFLFCIFTCVAQSKDSAAINIGLFDNDEILDITIRGNIKELLNDRSDNDPYRPQNLVYKNADSTEVSLQVEAKTRGHFRKMRENCIYPPILIHFIKNEQLQSSVFKGQEKQKLVMPCLGDEYVVREWLLYKIYNLITPASFRAKLVRVKLSDARSNKNYEPFYSILLEEEKQVTNRNNLFSVNWKMNPQDADTTAFITTAVFEYMIANTDWSVQYLQNIKMMATDSLAVPIAVPYDFDHSGMVNAPYAKPAEALLMSSVKERRYRGYCVADLKVFESTIATFNRLKDDIYKLYSGCTLLNAKYIKSALQYLDEFYATINNPKAWQKDFGYPCKKSGTGNVVIKGMSKD